MIVVSVGWEVARATPFHWTLQPAGQWAPVTVRVSAPEPAKTLTGLMTRIEGVGTATMVKTEAGNGLAGGIGDLYGGEARDAQGGGRDAQRKGGR